MENFGYFGRGERVEPGWSVASFSFMAMRSVGQQNSVGIEDCNLMEPMVLMQVGYKYLHTG